MKEIELAKSLRAQWQKVFYRVSKSETLEKFFLANIETAL